MEAWLVALLCTVSLLAGIVIGWSVRTSFAKRQQTKGY